MKKSRVVFLIGLISFSLIIQPIGTNIIQNITPQIPKSSGVWIEGIFYESNHTAISIPSESALDIYFAGNPEGMDGSESNPYVFRNLAIESSVAVTLTDIVWKYVIFENCVFFGGSIGFNIDNCQHLTIRNCIVFEMERGFRIIDSHDIYLENNLVLYSLGEILIGCAMVLTDSQCYITNNTIKHCTRSIKSESFATTSNYISGNTIFNSSSTGIEVTTTLYDYYVVVENNIITKCKYTAISLETEDSGIIKPVRNNYIENCGTGIIVADYFNVSQNMVFDCLGYGIRVDDFNNVTDNSILNCMSGLGGQDWNTIQNNSILQTDYSNTHYGVNLGSYNYFSSNVMRQIKQLEALDHNTIENNVLENSLYRGFRIDNNNTLFDNRIKDSAGGITSDGENNITANTLINCDYGIRIYDWNNTIISNVIQNCGQYGISTYYYDQHTYQCHGNDIKSNIITECEYGIIIAEESLNNDISKNSISNCDYGVRISGRAYENTIFLNNISDILHDGILLQGSETDVLNNSIDSCENGIYISSNYNLVANNTINDAENEGILEFAGIGNIISDNTITTTPPPDPQNIAPTITTPFSSIWILNTTQIAINWTITDDSMYLGSRTYTVRINGAFNSSGFWSPGGIVSIGVHQSVAGIYTYQLEVSDGYETVTDEVQVVVQTIPEPPPDPIPNQLSVSTPVSTVWLLNTSTSQFSINWTIEDDSIFVSRVYTIRIDGVINTTGTWISGDTKTIIAHQTTPGIYLYEIEVSDGIDTLTNLVYVIVQEVPEPEDDPELGIPTIFTPIDAFWIVNQTQFTINWTVFDDPTYLGSREYSIRVEGTIVETGTWDSSDIIDIPISHTQPGTYTYELEISDGYHNVTDTVHVVIQNIEFLPPVLETLIIEPQFEAVWIFNITVFTLNWTVRDDDMHLGTRNYTIRIDGVVVETGTWNPNDIISYGINQSVPNVYAYQLEVTDGYTNVTSTVSVVIQELKIPDIPELPTEPDDSIPGYNVFILIGVFGLLSAFLTLKYAMKQRNNCE